MCSGFSYPFYPKKIAIRIGWAACLLAAIDFSLIISTYMILYMTIPLFEDQISTVHDIISQDYTLAGDFYALQQLSARNEVTIVHYSFACQFISINCFSCPPTKNRHIHKDQWKISNYAPIWMFVWNNLI